jgi:uncharacterized protein (AIM24 family)
LRIDIAIKYETKGKSKVNLMRKRKKKINHLTLNKGEWISHQQIFTSYKYIYVCMHSNQIEAHTNK